MNGIKAFIKIVQIGIRSVVDIREFKRSKIVFEEFTAQGRRNRIAAIIAVIVKERRLILVFTVPPLVAHKLAQAPWAGV